MKRLLPFYVSLLHANNYLVTVAAYIKRQFKVAIMQSLKWLSKQLSGLISRLDQILNQIFRNPGVQAMTDGSLGLFHHSNRSNGSLHGLA